MAVSIVDAVIVTNCRQRYLLLNSQPINSKRNLWSSYRHNDHLWFEGKGRKEKGREHRCPRGGGGGAVGGLGSRYVDVGILGDVC